MGRLLKRGLATRRSANVAQGDLVQSTQRVIHRINDEEREVLKHWWEHEKKPTKDFVFPVRRGDRAGQRKKGTGYAAALRIAMRRALEIEVPKKKPITKVRNYANGTTRVMRYEKTIWEKKREPKGREVTLLEGDDDYRPLNMHTMRRAYASGLSLAGWSRAQMRNAGGWRTDAMPVRYDLILLPRVSDPVRVIRSLATRAARQPAHERDDDGATDRGDGIMEVTLRPLRRASRCLGSFGPRGGKPASVRQRRTHSRPGRC